VRDIYRLTSHSGWGKTAVYLRAPRSISITIGQVFERTTFLSQRHRLLHALLLDVLPAGAGHALLSRGTRSSSSSHTLPIGVLRPIYIQATPEIPVGAPPPTDRCSHACSPKEAASLLVVPYACGYLSRDTTYPAVRLITRH
jgi:hypothetical protein